MNVEAMDRKLIAKLKRRITLARRFPTNTDPFVRHLQMIGEALGGAKPYPMLSEEPLHCAVTMLSVVDSLYRARNEIERLTKRKPRTKARRTKEESK